MKSKHLMLKAFLALALFTGAGCTEIQQPYTIDAPSDLQDKIDAYAAEKKANQKEGTESIDIVKYTVGPDDCSAGWWVEFSDYFQIPTGKLLHLELVNHSSRLQNYHNWVLVVTTPYERSATGYLEYFALRPDAAGWQAVAMPAYPYDGGVLHMEVDGVAPPADSDPGVDAYWASFREYMDGAYCTIEIDHSNLGIVAVSIECVNGEHVITETYSQKCSTSEDIWAFLCVEGSYSEMKTAWLEDTKVEEIPDFDAESMTITGSPVAVPLGNEDYWGNTQVSVTFEDGSEATIEKDDLTILEPDMTTVGTKTVVVSYAKTKLGEAGKPVAAYYNFEVTDLASIEVTKAPNSTTYYVVDEAVPFYTTGMEVTGTKADGSKIVLELDALDFGTVQPFEGEQEIEVAFSVIKTTCKVNVFKGYEAIGATDYSNGWWTTFMSEDRPVEAGASVTVKMLVYSDNAGNWHSPCTILRGASLAEYAVVRMDNYGWGAGYDVAVLESNWNWDTFVSNISMSLVDITVTNNGDGTADILYNVTYANGEEHFQKYSGITVDSSDLQMGIVTEESYLVLYE